MSIHTDSLINTGTARLLFSFDSREYITRLLESKELANIPILVYRQNESFHSVRLKAVP